jgi:transglutaminase-like putative cysteine protease
MRQASWGELFAPRYQPAGAAPEVPLEPRGWRRLFWWEDLLTFGLLGIVLLAVIASIDRAHWVDTMPSLYPIAFFALFMGAVLARLHWREGFIHLLALPIGAAASLGQILSILPGHTPVARYDVLHDRMAAWFHIAFYGGISNDDLPFIVLVVPLVWLTSYLSSWAIFRWQNAWLALIPAGATLLVNISFLPGDFSLAFVVFLLGATLLITRLHLLERAKAWRAGNTPYPPLLSLSVLHATFWLGLVLLGLAWLLPQAGQTGALESVWNRTTSPVNDRAIKLSRLFVSVNNKKSLQVHDFGEILPFLGGIGLPDTPVADVTTGKPLDQLAYLRAQAYDIYTAQGWESAALGLYGIEPGTETGTDFGLAERLPIVISVISSGGTGDAILTIGQPVGVDRPAEVAARESALDRATRLVSPSALKQGDAYQSKGSVSTASEAELRAAGTDYPAWARTGFLGLPGSLPQRVKLLAQDWTLGKDNPYDQAVAIEANLHNNYPYDLVVAKTPPGRDTVDYFLFDLKRGYFDYHASAMVVLLRSLGIPARLAVGYVIDPSTQGSGKSYHITEANAFAWPEVYFPGYGWVEFNPTPNHPANSRASGAQDAVSSNDNPNAPDLGLGNLNPGGGAPQSGEAGSGLQAPRSTNRAAWLIGAVAAALALLLASSAAGLRFAWVRGLSGLDAPARLWGKTVRLASWARAAPAQDQTPREFARTLRAQVPGSEGVELLAESYVRHRYGRQAIAEDERARLEQAWRGVRKSLLRRLLRLP